MRSGSPRAAAQRPTAAWTHQAERSNMLVLQLMRWIAVAFGRRVSRWVLHPISLYFLLFGGEGARASCKYLQKVLGRRPSWRERYRHVHHFAATVLDRVYLLRGDFGQFDVRITGAEHLDPVLAQGQGALLMGAHFGSFEVLRSMGQSRHGLRVAVLMYEANARLINSTLKALAPNADLHVIGLGRMDSMLALREWLDGGGVAGILADRTLHSAQANAQAGLRSGMHSIEFLGEPALFSDGPFRLAALLRRPVVFMSGLYHGGRSYELRFEPLADFSRRPARGAHTQAAQEQAVREAMVRYVKLLESLCRETPWNWFNFFDFWAGSFAAPQPDVNHATDRIHEVHAGAEGRAAVPVAASAGAGLRSNV